MGVKGWIWAWEAVVAVVVEAFRDSASYPWSKKTP
jgi:hypothetical protein